MTRRTHGRWRSTSLALVGVALLFGIAIGLTQEPDSGTAASVGAPDVAGATVGADHAKPLPRLLSVAELLDLGRLLVPAAVALALLAGPPERRARRAEPERDRPPGEPRWLARARRGPPAPV